MGSRRPQIGGVFYKNFEMIRNVHDQIVFHNLAGPADDVTFGGRVHDGRVRAFRHALAAGIVDDNVEIPNVDRNEIKHFFGASAEMRLYLFAQEKRRATQIRRMNENIFHSFFFNKHRIAGDTRPQRAFFK